MPIRPQQSPSARTQARRRPQGAQQSTPVTTFHPGALLTEHPRLEDVASSVQALGVHDAADGPFMWPHLPPMLAAYPESLQAAHPPLAFDAFSTQQPASVPSATVTLARKAASAALLEHRCQPAWQMMVALLLLMDPSHPPLQPAILGWAA